MRNNEKKLLVSVPIFMEMPFSLFLRGSEDQMKACDQN